MLFAANAPAQKESASVFVASFYKFHRVRLRDFNAGEVNLHKRWFTADLNRLFQNELKREKEYLKQNPTDKPHFGDGFPFAPLEECASNGKSVKNVLKTGATTADGDKTLVEITFSQPKACGGASIETDRVELVKNKGGWLISDWIYADGKRLSEDLKREEY